MKSESFVGFDDTLDQATQFAVVAVVADAAVVADHAVVA